ncbi:simple sugar transport system permease protein [Zhihengliuella halotolerans]|uniref:Simple sugar transport system permease protein n=2 Tax=Zhihengliuella halotolerans TaxID=370736 RepID=A0A4Q8AEB1_9MICC|nr:simple sugar transport system permease protein [Zhihengliuella halotolerans]
MSTATASATGAVHVMNKRALALYGLGAAVALVLFGFLSPGGTASFRLSSAGDAVQLPLLTLPVTATGWLIAILLVAGAAYAFWSEKTARRLAGWVPAIFALLFVIGILVWLVGSSRASAISLLSLLTGSLALALPMVYGSLGGVLAERSGVVNIAIEGQLLLGAFAAALGGSLSGSVVGAMVSAALGGVVVSSLLTLFAVKYRVNQIIVGVVLNVLVSGLTGFLFGTLLSSNRALNSPPRLSSFAIPGLSEIPILGPLLFNQTILGYLMFVAVGVLWFGLYKTRWGLRVRAVGEHPKAADTVGINVNRTRVINVLIGGAVAGLGGSFYTLVSVSQFSRDMTAGTGFIALAALIFGRWNPIGAFFASLLFGFATNLQYVLSQAGTDVPSQFLAMLPYVITIFAVAGLVGASRAPAASGQPYVKD